MREPADNAGSVAILARRIERQRCVRCGRGVNIDDAHDRAIERPFYEQINRAGGMAKRGRSEFAEDDFGPDKIALHIALRNEQFAQLTSRFAQMPHGGDAENPIQNARAKPLGAGDRPR